MWFERLYLPALLIAACLPVTAGAQSAPASAPAPQANSLAQAPGASLVTVDDAIKLALQHNHTLQAARTVIQQNKAEEITANLRPDPVLMGDSQFLPVFNPSQFTSDYLDQVAQFDLGVSYLFERGRKRQHRLQAARDVTAVSEAQVADNERTLTFSVASQFITVELAESTLELANEDLKSFENTVGISEARYKAGDMSEGDLLKIKLQLLQFQMDVSQAKLGRAQGLSDLRQMLGYESVAPDYDIAGAFQYVPVSGTVEDFQAMALQDRPDLREAQLGVTAANSQHELQKAIGKRDVTGQVNYTHLTGINNLSLFGSIELPIFDRNQGEIARSGIAITQAQEQMRFTNGQVLTDVRDAYEGLHANDEIVKLYRSGYLDQAQESRDISEYAYKRGAASLLDFLDAERSYRATQLGYRQSLAAYLTSLEQLREAVGTRSIP
ncbi:RND transporter [Edaphobacter acidisoli]|uniref:RND transporter n=1 Tax=Edaphobacter acidisoli TaxID=2040573 RepID=A0A916S1T2_9BACT|nr:TolC family protein [Edaphobacter acidisoli]GGA79729.1 RND transporter [Edaphobacter acidisoli]